MRGRLVIGFIVLLLGVGFLLDALDFPPGFHFADIVFDYWPVVLIVIGLAQVRHSPMAAGILILVGGAILAHNALDLRFSVWSLIWPAVLILIGLALLFPHGRRHRGGRRDVRVTGRLERTAVMGGFKERVEGEFHEGSVTILMGGGDVDLRWARLGPEGATIEATAIMGSVKLIVPDSWRMDVTGPGIFGAIENKAASPASGPVLHVKATAIIGAVEITN